MVERGGGKKIRGACTEWKDWKEKKWETAKSVETSSDDWFIEHARRGKNRQMLREKRRISAQKNKKKDKDIDPSLKALTEMWIRACSEKKGQAKK